MFEHEPRGQQFGGLDALAGEQERVCHFAKSESGGEGGHRGNCGSAENAAKGFREFEIRRRRGRNDVDGTVQGRRLDAVNDRAANVI